MKLLFALLLISSAYATEIPTTRNMAPMLGQGYLSERQSLAGECLTGETVFEGSPEASISYASSISEQQLASELGLAAGAKARLGVMQASASASFFNASRSDAFSVSAIYTGTYFFKNRILKNPKLVNLNLNPEQWRETCGDEYVAQQTLGAKLFFSIRIDFLSEQEKNAFATHFSFDSPLASASAAVNRAVSSLSKRTRVTINVLQIGGKVDRVTEIFQGKDSTAYQFVQCSSGNFEKCQAVLAQAVAYATDTKNGFPSQINPEDGGPAVLSSTTQSYRMANIFLEMTPELDSQIKLARQQISQKYEVAYKQYSRVRRLIRDGVMRLSPKQREKFTEMEVFLFDFLQRSTESSLRCFNSPKQCSAAYQDIDEALYVEKDFLVEPEIFSQYCDLGQSPLAQKSLKRTMTSLVQIAQKSEPDLFIPAYEGAVVDPCHAAELAYARMTDLSLGGYVIEDLRPIALLTHLRTLDMRESDSRLKCPFEDATRCIRADFRSRNSFMAIHKDTKTLRVSHVATVLDDHQILITGNSQYAELFDPKTGQFELVGEQIVQRYYHTATKLKGGQVLLVGGFGRLASQSAEIFDSRIQRFSKVVSAPLFHRTAHTATLLADGRVLIAGGWSSKTGLFTDATTTAEIYDPKTQNFTQVASMNLPRASHKATLLNDNRVLITGDSTAEIYDPVLNQWRLVRSRMSYSRAEHTATKLQDGCVLIAGGFNNTAEIFDPQTESFIELSSLMSESRGEHEAVLLSDGRVVIFGGRSVNKPDVDMDGRHIEGLHATAEIFDPTSQLFTKLSKPMTSPRAIFTATSIAQNRILLVGGLGGLASYSAELFEYTP
jgi:hypothetical protein